MTEDDSPFESGPTAGSTIDRRSLLRRLAATSAVAWAAPEILATKRAVAAPLSGCYTEYNFDDGTLQGWIATNAGASGWQVSGLHPNSGSYSAWFGRPGPPHSLHPVPRDPAYRLGNRPVSGTLRSPATTVSSTDLIFFAVRLSIESAPSHDVFRLWAVQGANRRLLWDKSSLGLTPVPHPEDPGSSRHMITTNGGYVHVEVAIGTLPGFDPDAGVQFEFDFQSVDGSLNRTEGIYLDDILIPCGAAAPGAAGTSPALSPATVELERAYVPPPTVAPPPEGRERRRGRDAGTAADDEVDDSGLD